MNNTQTTLGFANKLSKLLEESLNENSWVQEALAEAKNDIEKLLISCTVMVCKDEFLGEFIVRLDFHKLTNLYENFDINLVKNRFMILDVHYLYREFTPDLVVMHNIDVVGYILGRYAFTEMKELVFLE